MRHLGWVLAIALAPVSAGCGGGVKSSAGFRLPDGDIEKGRAAFVELRCTDCHQVTGLDFPVRATGLEKPIVLGGDVFYTRTDGDLVTAIINPSHRLMGGYPKDLVSSGGKSRMRDYSDLLTVRQLVDLVAFLHTRYKVVPPPTHPS